MSALPANFHVVCTTSDNEEIPVRMSVLLASETIGTMHKDLDLQAEDQLRIPIECEARVLKQVVAWLEIPRHKNLELTLDRDPVTQVRTWTSFPFPDFFADYPMPDLAKLIIAADYLHIPALYSSLCQAVADRLKGKTHLQMRRILQQHYDFDEAEAMTIAMENPWIKQGTEVHDRLGNVEFTIHFTASILLDIFVLLRRRDIDSLQLVNQQCYRLIAFNAEFSASRGPLRQLHEINVPDARRIQLDEAGPNAGSHNYIHVSSFAILIERMKFCVAKRAWFRVSAGFPLAVFEGDPAVDACFKEIYIQGRLQEQLADTTLFSLKSIQSCAKLDLATLTIVGDPSMPIDNALPFPVKPELLIEWLFRPPQQRWPLHGGTKKRTLSVDASSIVGGLVPFATLLEEAFKADTEPKCFVICLGLQSTFSMDHHVINEHTKEVLIFRDHHWSADRHLATTFHKFIHISRCP